MRTLQKRESLLLAVLPVIAVLSAVADSGQENKAVPVEQAAAAPVEQAAAAPVSATDDKSAGDSVALGLPQPQRGDSADEPSDLFAAKSWYVPPPPPPPPPQAKPAPPPRPTAPPLPFAYLGSYQESATHVIFLVRGDRILTVSIGEVIEGTYRVNGITGSTLSLTYLPLNVVQSLNIGSAG